MSEWKPIETAPKGLLVIVYSPAQDGDYEDSIRLDFDMIDPETEDYWIYHGEQYEHFLSVGYGAARGPKQIAPYTHWMELPEKPDSNSESV